VIAPGSGIETKDQTSAIITFTDGSFVKLPPLTRIELNAFTGKDGKKSTALTLESGKLWLQATKQSGREELGTRYIIGTPDGAFDTYDAALFAESDPSLKSSCIDVFSGAGTIHPMSDIKKSNKADAGKRYSINDLAPEKTESLSSGFDAETPDYSCLASANTVRSGSAAISAFPVNEDETLVKITASANVEFSGSPTTGSVSFQSENEMVVSANATVQFSSCAAEKEACASDAECCSSFCDNKACKENPRDAGITTAVDGSLVFPVDPNTEIESYETVTISKSTTAVFESTKCEIQPEISRISVAGRNVSEGETVELENTDCATSLNVNIAWSAAPKCGGISSMKMKNGASSRDLGTVSEGQTKSFQNSFQLTGSDPVSVELTAADGEGNSASFAFSVKLRQRESSPPKVTIEMVGLHPADDFTSTLELFRDQLDAGKIVVRGTAEPDTCATISKTEVSIDGGSSWSTANGTQNWSYGFTPAERTYGIKARTTDSAGAVSEDIGRALEFNYHAMTSEDDLREVFSRLIQAYVDKNTGSFIELTSRNFSSSYEGLEDSRALDSSLDNKFTAIPIIYLRYSIDTVTITGDTGRVGFYWDSEQGAAGYRYYGVFSFLRESDGWRFNAVYDDNTFLRYTSVASKLVLTSPVSSVIANNSSTVTLTAEVRDSANNLIKDGTIVSFSTTLGSITPTATTRSGIAEATLFAGFNPGAAEITATCSGITSSPVSIEFTRESAPPPPGP